MKQFARQQVRKMNKNHVLNTTALTPSASKRGISLLEGVLYLTLALSVLGFSASFISQQKEIQENIQVTSTLRELTDAGQLYLSGEYDQIRENLAGTAADPASTVLEDVITMQDMADFGYYPAAMVSGGEFEDLFEQNYAILVRGVNANDGSVPQATLTRGDVVDGTGIIDPDMIDGDPANGEYELEAILVSYGGNLVPQLRGGPITNGTGRSSTGFLPERLPGDADPIEAFGPRGGFAFDVTGFSDDILASEGTAFFPQPDGGRFISLLALSNYGALNSAGLVPGEGGTTDGVFYRCNQILETTGLDQNSSEYQDCLNTNEIHDEIVFNTSFDPTFKAAIRNVNEIEFEADGTGEIQNLAAIHCGTASGLPTSVDNLRINCGTTIGPFDTALLPGFGIGDLGVSGTARVNGAFRVDSYTSLGANVDVDGNASIAGNTSIGGDATVTGNAGVSGNATITGDADVDGDATFGGAVTLDTVNGGQDVREGIYHMYKQASDTTVSKPSCPAGFTENILTSVASYADPQGRGSVGVSSFVEDEGASWRLRMVMFLDEDVCDNGSLGPYLDPTLSPAANGCSGGDGLSDIYEVPASAGYITAQTQCVAP
jgi:cell division protein FtsL